MTTLVANRTFGAIAAALALTACAQTESPRPRLLTTAEARVSAIDPVVLADEVFVPVAVDRDVGLLHVVCPVAPSSGRPRLIAAADCVALLPNAPRID